MTKLWTHYRFLIARRMVQCGILILLVGAHRYGWHLLKGTLSMSYLVDTVPLADPFAVLQMLASGFLVGSDVLLGAAIVVLLYIIVGGRAFCSWVCPINVVTDSANWLRRKLGLGDVVRQYTITKNIRYWLIGLSLILSALMGVAAFEFISPIAMLHRGVVFGMGFGWAALSMVFLFDLFIMKNGFCGHLCPLGGFYALVGKASLLRVRHDAEACVSCMDCVLVCPERQVLDIIGKQSGIIARGECTNCLRCIEVCRDQSLFFGTRFNRKKI